MGQEGQNKLSFGGVASALLLTSALASWATSARAQQPAADPDGLDTIIVTAQKREESIQDVPLSIAALSAEELNNRGATNFADIARSIPGISFLTSGGDGIRPIIRGVNSIGTGAPTVAIYLDDAPIQVRDSFRGAGGSADIQLVDLDRVEVLRGPQGTLYGGSSLGGAIKYVTKAPNLTESEGVANAELSFTKGGEASFAAQLGLATPLVTDQIGLRGSFSFRRDGGWIDQVAPGGGATIKANADRADQYAGHAALLIKPNEALEITANYFGQKNDADALSYSNSALGIGRYDNRLPETSKDESHLGSLRATYDFGGVSLFSQISYFDRRYRRAEDYSVVLVDAGLVDALGLPADTTIANLAYQKQRVLTGEVRLASEGEGAFRWTVGAFYTKSKLFSRQTIDANGLVDEDGNPQLLFVSLNDQDDRQFAVFGEASYRFFEIATLTVGGRYSWLKVNVGRQALGLLGDAGEPPSLFVRKDKSFDPKINLSVKPGAETLVYVQAAKGFRPGEASSLLPDSCSEELAQRGITDTNGFGPDKIWTYEGGLKTTFFGDRARINASIYHSDWSDKPESIGLNSCGFSATLPIGKVKIDGFELETNFKPVNWAALDFSLGYTNPKFDIAEPSLEIKKGDRLGLVSRWTVSAATTFTLPVTDTATLAWRTDYTWRSRSLVIGQSTTEPTVVNRKTDAYGIVNTRISVERGPFSAYVFADNLFDRRPIIGVDELTPVALVADRVSSLRPRTIGLGGQVRF